jgi:hypothetical protein
MAMPKKREHPLKKTLKDVVQSPEVREVAVALLITVAKKLAHALGKAGRP